MKILSIGEVLWDVFPERELLGGAALNFSANLNRLGDDAVLITAVGNDRRGKLAIEQMQALGVATNFVQVIPDASTGIATVETGNGGEPRFDIRRPAAYDRINISADMLTNLRAFEPGWLYFGTLLQIHSETEAITRTLAGLSPRIRCFYDLNLRPDQWTLPLVQRLCRLANILKLNREEASMLSCASGTERDSADIEQFCRRWSGDFDLDTICVTLGAEGCLVYQQGSVYRSKGFPVSIQDTVGSGDAFAAAFLHGYDRNWPIEKTARFANALGSIVAGRSGANPPWTVEELAAIAEIGELV